MRVIFVPPEGSPIEGVSGRIPQDLKDRVKPWIGSEIQVGVSLPGFRLEQPLFGAGVGDGERPGMTRRFGINLDWRSS